MSYYQLFKTEFIRCFDQMEVTLGSQSVSQEDGFKAWRDLSKTVQAEGREMFFVGNGASAAMAAHMSADTLKNGQILARCFNESSLMTAIGNDLAYDEVFSFPLSKYGKRGDVLVTISSSGNSPNVVKAIHTAKEKGLKVVTLSGMKPDNKSRALGDINFWVPSKSYGLVESSHAALLHCWLDMFMDLKPE